MLQGLGAPYSMTLRRGGIVPVRGGGQANKQVKQSTAKQRCFGGWIVFLTQC